jgi:GDP-L-fucose synthase
MITVVTGGTGMVGKCLQEIIKKNKELNENDFIFLSSSDCDLTNITQVEELFKRIKPNYIIHLAANVGGLYKNLREKTQMFKDNVRMNENVLEMANKYNVQRGIFCLSSCIFPHNPSKYPMDESMMHESEPHPSNQGYGYSKRMMEIQCKNYNEQFKREYLCLIPVNLYGPYDNFNLEDSHVIPGLIHRFYKNKQDNSSFQMYGTGKPLRQFVFSYDFSELILKFLFEYSGDKTSIICCNDEISINELTMLISRLSNYDTNKITCDLTKSDGCMKKTVDGSLLKQIYPEFKFTSLPIGLEKTIKWFENNYDQCRK